MQNKKKFVLEVKTKARVHTLLINLTMVIR